MTLLLGSLLMLLILALLALLVITILIAFDIFDLDLDTVVFILLVGIPAIALFLLGSHALGTYVLGG